MLQIVIPEKEYFDELKEEFVIKKEQTLQLEHSLISISKWEAKYHKPFLSKEKLTPEETVDYIKCMTLTKNVDPDLYTRLSRKNYEDISDYLENSMTATTISKDSTSKSTGRQRITTELIYSWMSELNIPYEAERWHFNRLITLIQVRNIRSQPPKKRTKKDIARRNAELNAARRKQLNTTG